MKALGFTDPVNYYTVSRTVVFVLWQQGGQSHQQPLTRKVYTDFHNMKILKMKE